MDEIKKLNDEEHEQILEILKKFEPLINKITIDVKRRCNRLDYKDIKQTLIYRILKSFSKYDKNQSEVAYFYKVLIREGNNISRAYYSEKNKIYISLLSLDEVIDINDDSSATFVDVLEDENNYYFNPESFFMTLEVQDKIKEAYSLFSEHEKKVFNLFVNGKNLSEIAQLINKSKKTIYNTLERIKEKINNTIK